MRKANDFIFIELFQRYGARFTLKKTKRNIPWLVWIPEDTYVSVVHRYDHKTKKWRSHMRKYYKWLKPSLMIDKSKLKEIYLEDKGEKNEQ